MAKKIFSVGDIPIFIVAEDESEAMQFLDAAIYEVQNEYENAFHEIEGEVVDLKPEADSKLN